MWNCAFQMWQFALLVCVGILIFISMFQCWTAAPSSLLFKSFYWSTSSCVDSSRATRPLHYRRYIVSVSMVNYWVLLLFIFGRVEKVQHPWALLACHKTEFACLNELVKVNTDSLFCPFRSHRCVSCANSPLGYSPTTLLSFTHY